MIDDDWNDGFESNGVKSACVCVAEQNQPRLSGRRDRKTFFALEAKPSQSTHDVAFLGLQRTSDVRGSSAPTQIESVHGAYSRCFGFSLSSQFSSFTTAHLAPQSATTVNLKCCLVEIQNLVETNGRHALERRRPIFRVWMETGQQY